MRSPRTPLTTLGPPRLTGSLVIDSGVVSSSEAQPPHLYRLTDGAKPDAPEGNDLEERPLELQIEAPTLDARTAATTPTTATAGCCHPDTQCEAAVCNLRRQGQAAQGAASQSLPELSSSPAGHDRCAGPPARTRGERGSTAIFRGAHGTADPRAQPQALANQGTPRHVVTASSPQGRPRTTRWLLFCVARSANGSSCQRPMNQTLVRSQMTTVLA